MKYPCDECVNKSKDVCTNYPTCNAWRTWFSEMWQEARERLKGEKDEM